MFFFWKGFLLQQMSWKTKCLKLYSSYIDCCSIIYNFNDEYNTYTTAADYRSFHSSWKVTKLLHETETKVDLAQLEKWK